MGASMVLQADIGDIRALESTPSSRKRCMQVECMTRDVVGSLSLRFAALLR